MTEQETIKLYSTTTIWTYALLEALEEKIVVHLGDYKIEHKEQDNPD